MPVQKIVPKANTSHGPAISVIGGDNPQLYLAWKNASDNTIWWAVYNSGSGNWSMPVQVFIGTGDAKAPALTSAGPALGAFILSDFRLGLAWQGVSDNMVWYSVYDGNSWSPQVPVSAATANAGAPSLSTIVSTGFSIITWRNGTDSTVWYAQQNDDGTWSQAQQIPDAKTSARPTILIVDGDATAGAIAWKGESDNTIWIAQETLENDFSFGPQQRFYVHQARTNVGPTLGAADAGTFLACKGESDYAIWWSFLSNTAWTPQQRIPGVGTSAEPAVAGDTKYGSQAFLAWKGESDSLIWFSSSSDGMTWTI
jgi:hypothetical protein